MRIATYNVEWFNRLFDDNSVLVEDGSWSGRYNITKQQQIKALGRVFKALKADAIMIIEAPNTGHGQSSVTALENFAARFRLRQNRALSGFANETQQEITLLYDPKIMQVDHDPKGEPTTAEGSNDAPRFDGIFQQDLDADARPEKVRFSKPPLELSVTPKVGPPFRMIGVHAKSKAPHGAKNRKEEIQKSVENRRKQLAQCVWIRQRVDAHLTAGEHLIVLGDFNDGPGLDEYEQLFGASGIEIVLAADRPNAQRMYEPHAQMALSQRVGAVPTTSRFFNHKTKRYLNALLDYVMVSDGLYRTKNPQWKIWHPFDDPDCYQRPKLKKALLAASDHFPVTVDLEL